MCYKLVENHQLSSYKVIFDHRKKLLNKSGNKIKKYLQVAKRKLYMSNFWPIIFFT